MAKMNSAPARGMRDLLPEQVERRDRAVEVILDVYNRFGFRRVETPALEHIGLLTSGQGGDNEKLIFQVLKRGKKLDLAAATCAADVVDFGLRYDLTVPLARFYAAHAAELPQPFRSIQVGPVWRADRPQRGRYRQFTQCDIDVLGEASELAEIELIQATVAALSALGLTGITVRLNDRRLLSALVRGCGFPEQSLPEVFIAVDKLDKIGMAGVAAELEAKGHGPELVGKLAAMLEPEGTSDGADALAGLQDAAELSADERRAASRLLSVRELAGRGLPEGARVEYDPTLVRGMGYYTGTIFEVSLEGYDFSIAGGGRYDELIGGMTGKAVPACGFSIGFERVLMILEDMGHSARRPELRVALLRGEQLSLTGALQAAEQLRARDFAVTSIPKRKKIARQLDELRAQGYDRFVVLDADPVGDADQPLDVRSFSDS
jgi:histidyl-tRNA synthetase